MKFIYPISSLFSLRKVRSLLSFGVKGYLAEIGWMEAYRARVPLDKDKQPLPWFTYSFIDFMEPRLANTLHVFEYGSGYSTRYFSKRVASVTSVEHDREWLAAGMKDKGENVTLVHYEGIVNSDYCRAATLQGKKFDVVLIDGFDRNNCCKHAAEALSEQGVIIFDDSQLEKFQEGVAYLKQAGFKMLPFSGISPGLFYRKETSVFYRPNNCFSI